MLVDVKNLEQISQRLDGSSPVEILHWAIRTFGDGLVATSSFQSQSLPLLHLISRICPHVPVYFLDTGFHFPETLAYAKQLKVRMNLNLQLVRPLLTHAEFLEQNGELYESNPDMCCYLNKVEPMQRALLGKSAWITGIRRDQTKQRNSSQVLTENSDGVIKVAPMLNWTNKDVDAYLKRHELPEHPLLEAGYRSIGCAPCTKPVAEGADARSGRWLGQQKTECGLHFDPSTGKLIQKPQLPQ